MSSPTRIGLLLANLGTPAAPTAAALRPFLAEFLGDPRVVELPRWQWLPILHGFILPFRPRKSAALYRKVWTEAGSPLLVYSRLLGIRVAESLGEELARGLRIDRTDPDGRHPGASGTERNEIVLEVGMRYGEPSVGDALRRLRTAGCSRILVLPLYPQYSATTTGSTFDAVWSELRTWRVVPEVRTVASYAEDPGYLDALVASVRELWAREGEPERLLLSFHGIPRRYASQGDPYPEECQRTARGFGARLGVADGRIAVSFQSVFGREEWIGPATEATVRRLAAEGVRSLDVICPGFSVDCLETLEEIDGLNREIFLHAGGTRFRYIPCLNDRPDHAAALARILARNLDGWCTQPQAAAIAAGRS